MRNSFKIYSNNVLPAGFLFPSLYVDLSRNFDEINEIPYFTWWFQDCTDEQFLLRKANLKKLTGVDNLISFARDGDWAACFNLLDRSGDPKVYVYDLGNRNNHYEVNNFEEWLKLVISEAQK